MRQSGQRPIGGRLAFPNVLEMKHRQFRSWPLMLPCKSLIGILRLRERDGVQATRTTLLSCCIVGSKRVGRRHRWPVGSSESLQDNAPSRWPGNVEACGPVQYTRSTSSVHCSVRARPTNHVRQSLRRSRHVVWLRTVQLAEKD